MSTSHSHLKIPSTDMFAVIYVQLAPDGKTQFSTNQSHWENHLDWHPPEGSNNPLNIVFVLGAGISGMTSKNTANLQMSNTLSTVVVATVQTTADTDSFTVNKTDGTGEDPKIIVTPQ
jgi:hypothetical protein